MNLAKRLTDFYWGLLLIFVLVPRVALGGPETPPCRLDDPSKLCNPIRYNSIDAFLLEILKIVVQYGSLLIVFFLVYAGFQFVTAQGNTEKLSQAKQSLTWVVVGAFVLLGVYVLRAAICGTVKQLGINQNLNCSISG